MNDRLQPVLESGQASASSSPTLESKPNFSVREVETGIDRELRKLVADADLLKDLEAKSAEGVLVWFNKDEKLQTMIINGYGEILVRPFLDRGENLTYRYKLTSVDSGNPDNIKILKQNGLATNNMAFLNVDDPKSFPLAVFYLSFRQTGEQIGQTFTDSIANALSRAKDA